MTPGKNVPESINPAVTANEEGECVPENRSGSLYPATATVQGDPNGRRLESQAEGEGGNRILAEAQVLP